MHDIRRLGEAAARHPSGHEQSTPSTSWSSEATPAAAGAAKLVPDIVWSFAETPVPFAAMQEALDAGKIDLGQFPQPFAALAEKQTKVRKIFDAKYGIPFDEELTVVVGA